MQMKVTLTAVLGFVLGLGLVSCASVECGRSVASDGSPRYTASGDRHEDKQECQLGEERNEDGDCVRPHDFDRPFRRGGR